jgi:hypothetical protein
VRVPAQYARAIRAVHVLVRNSRIMPVPVGYLYEFEDGTTAVEYV